MSVFFFSCKVPHSVCRLVTSEPSFCLNSSSWPQNAEGVPAANECASMQMLPNTY
jgi:hypothetical protein